MPLFPGLRKNADFRLHTAGSPRSSNNNKARQSRGDDEWAEPMHLPGQNYIETQLSGHHARHQQGPRRRHQRRHNKYDHEGDGDPVQESDLEEPPLK
jgi:hypothetical protein